MLFRKIHHRHFEGPGGIAELIPIAIPIIVSNASETVMMFVDRLYLAHLSKQHMAAAMIGGLSMFTSLAFFVGVMNYTNALVAQHFGSQQQHRCPVAVIQALVLALLAVPYMIVMGLAVPKLFALFDHGPMQLELETTYFQLLMVGGILVLARFAFTGFFAGIGRTRIVMIANFAAMLVNVGANYVLIFGKLGVPPLGIAGAALGTIVARLTAVVILLIAYLSRHNRSQFQTHRHYSFERSMFVKLLKFGAPAGTELFLSMAAFNLVIQLLHSYGPNVAAAVTITFNWDIVAFIPMIGFQVGTMSLVGRYMGAGKIALAERSAYSGLKMAYCYAGVMTLVFLFGSRLLASVFAPDVPGLAYDQVLPLAEDMIRLAAVYILADATFLVFGGALRGAGDTRWIMIVTVLLHWIMVAVLFTGVFILNIKPLTAWSIFIAFVVSFGFTAFLRFRSGKWRDIEMVRQKEKTAPARHTPQPKL